MTCPKCKAKSGDDWSQCNGSCPMPMSPYYVPEKIAFGGTKYMIAAVAGFKDLEVQDQSGKVIWKIPGEVPTNLISFIREIEKRYNGYNRKD